MEPKLMIAPLRDNRSFQRLFVARVISHLGTAVGHIAFAFAVLDLGHGTTGVAVVLGAEYIVHMLALPIGGWAADRFPRGQVVGWSFAVAGLSQALMAALVLTRAADLITVACVAVIGAASGAFNGPALRALVPSVVPPQQIASATRLLQTQRNMITVGGPIVGGALVAGIGSGPVLAFDAATFLLAGLLMIGLTKPATPSDRQDDATAGGFWDGWRALAAQSWLWSTKATQAITTAAFLSGVSVLGPAYAKIYLNGPQAWGLVDAGFGAGLLLGSMIALAHPPGRVPGPA